MQPRPELRIVIGGTGTHRTPMLAGRYADELNAYPASPELFAAKVGRAREAAVAAGRDPSRLTISSSGFFIAGDTEAEYRDRLAEYAAESGATVADLEESMRVRNSPHGTWDQVRAMLVGLEEAGLDRFFIQTLRDDQKDVGDSVGEAFLGRLPVSGFPFPVSRFRFPRFRFPVSRKGPSWISHSPPLGAARVGEGVHRSLGCLENDPECTQPQRTGGSPESRPIR